MVEIEFLDYTEDVYDIEVENTNNFFANGILVHNCNLVSVVATNLVNKDDDFIKDVVYYSVLILDRSIDEGTAPVLEAEKASKSLRNIGIGVVGLADYMAYNNKMYDKEDGQEFAEKFIEKIAYYSYSASNELAKEYGSYPLFKPENYNKLLGRDPKELDKLSLNGFDWSGLAERIRKDGIRNFLLNAIAPNSSTGVLTNAVASYLPVYNKEMTQTLADLSVPIIPKFIEKKYWYYKTKYQYHPADIIKFTARIGKWIDTGLSMEININPSICKINEISDAIINEMLNNHLKAVYYNLTIDEYNKRNKNNKNNKGDKGCTDCAN